MLSVNDLSINFAGNILFSRVDLQFTPGNCYGIIGANGAGKSTLLRLISGDEEPTAGHIYIDPKARMSVLKQNQTMYDEYPVLETVIMGNMTLYNCGKEKDAMLEGTRIHKMIQNRHASEGGYRKYRSEVTLKREIPGEGFVLMLEGRADGLYYNESDELCGI